jgi:hypothetical protein
MRGVRAADGRGPSTVGLICQLGAPPYHVILRGIDEEDLRIATWRKRAEIERDLRMRRQVYPKLVSEGRMSREVMERRIAVLEAVLADYAPPQPALL